MLLYLKGCSGGFLAQQCQPVPGTGVLRHQIGWETCTKWNWPLWEWHRYPTITSHHGVLIRHKLWSTQKVASNLKTLWKIKKHLGLILSALLTWDSCDLRYLNYVCQANAKLLLSPSNNVETRPFVFIAGWKYCWEKSQEQSKTFCSRQKHQH